MNLWETFNSHSTLNIHGTVARNYSALNVFFYFLAATLLVPLDAHAQLFNFTTIAGYPGQGFANGSSTNAQFASPSGIAMDPAGNLFVADTANHVIRKTTPTGIVSTFAGLPGISGTNDGNSALFNSPQSVAADSSGNIYVADTGNFTIRKITASGTVSTIAGSAGIPGSADGTNASALFFESQGLTVDGFGNIFVCDTWNHTIRKVTPAGVVSTFAGSPGNFGSSDASGTNALFYEPQGITIDSLGNLYVADTGNHTVRKISALGAVSTLAGYAGNYGSANGTGTNASFYAPQGISLDALGNVYVADTLNNAIRKITSAGTVTTIAGAPGSFGATDGTNNNATFWGPQAILVNPTNSNTIYIADTGNSIIRQLAVSGSNYAVSTLAGSASIGSANGPGGSVRFFWPMAVAADSSGNIYIADAANNVIRKMTSAGTVSTLAGSGGIGSTDGTGTNASFNNPQALAVNTSGNVFVSDTGNSTIRKITPGGAVSTLAGSPSVFSYSDGTNSTALFNAPLGMAVDGSGNIFVADSLNQTIRKITSAGVVTTIAGFVGLTGSADGTNSNARFDHPAGLAIDGSGNLFVTDLYNHTVREITPAGAVTTVAGLAGVQGNADGTNNAALFFEPEGIAVDGTNIYVADSGNHTIRQLNQYGTNWVSTTIAGFSDNSGNADGSGVAARFCYPAGLGINGGNLLVADSGNNTLRSGSMITDSPPAILTQPQSQAVFAGAPVTFTVSATAASPLYYQWQFNGSGMPGAISNSLTLTNVQPANAGLYSVLVISPTGSALSSNALLSVYVPPAITNQPASQTCLQGSTIALSVVAGPSPLTYQWQKNGVPISNLPYVTGAATSTLVISNSTTADSGSYSVIIKNSYGTVASSPAALTVFFVPPPDSIQPYAWWQLNEGVGSEAFDYSGNSHHGALNSGATWTSNGLAGNGVYFNATAPSQVVVANPFIWPGDWTAAMWVNRWESKDASVLIGGTHDSLKLEQHSQTNHVGYTVYGTADWVFNYVTPLNNWVHLAFVKSAAGVSLYANGALVASSSHSNSLDVTTLGCDNFTDYLDATLNDVRIYTNALSAAQLLSLYTYDRITPIPAITLNSPTNGTVFTAAASIFLTASVITNAQTINNVAFFSGTNLLGRTSVSPYQWLWPNVPTGDYIITAQVTYNGTNTVASPAVGVSVFPATNSPALSFLLNGGALQISWPSDHTGWSLQSQTNTLGAGLTTNWVTVAASNSTNQMILPVVPSNGGVFYRLTYP